MLLRRFFYAVIQIVIIVLLLEFLLRIFTPFFNPALRAFINEESYQSTLSVLRVAHGTQIILKEKDFKKEIDVVAVGDSMVFCSLADISETWPMLVEQKSRLKVLNLGVGSQGPCAYNYMLETLLPLLSKSPSVIFYTIFVNDLLEDECLDDVAYENLFIWENNYKSNYKLQLRKIREQLFQHSIVYQLMKRLLTSRTLGSGGLKYRPLYVYDKDSNLEFIFAPPTYWDYLLDDAEVTEGIKRTVSKIQVANKIATEYKSELVIVLMPFKEQIYMPLYIEKGILQSDSYNSNYNIAYDVLASEISKFGIKIIDLRPQFQRAAKRGAKLFWTFDGHCTPEGNNSVADTITIFLQNEKADQAK